MLKKTDDDAVSSKPEARSAPRRGIKRLALPILAVAVIGGGLYYGHYWWTEGRFLVSTDDAYVAADMALITARVTGYVTAVPVRENQSVRAGETLVEIDPGDLALELKAADARLSTQEAAITRMRAQRDAARAALVETQARREALQSAAAEAERSLARAQDLARSGAAAQAALDQAQNARDQAAATLRGGAAAIDSAQANIAVLDAQIAEQERTLEERRIDQETAARNLTFAALKAPYDGVVGNLSVQPGDLVSPSRRLMTVVPLADVYIDANFKETQLGRIAVGDKAHIEVDALPDQTFMGTVESVSPASGSVFSLLPADNATGNFTKIVQRVPVRIHLDPGQDSDGRLRPGLSTQVTIDIRTAPGAATNGG